MRLLSWFIFFMIFMVNAQAQQEKRTYSYQAVPRSHNLNIGVGFFNPTNFAFSLFGASGEGDPSASINLWYEYQLTKTIGLGAMGSYYRVNSSTQINASDFFENILDNPQCALECITGFSIGGNCNCDDLNFEERVHVYTFAGKVSLHIKRFEQLDTYSNIVLGYSINKRKSVVDAALNSALDQVIPETEIPSFIYYASLGARYYLSEKWGIYGEFGYGNVHLFHLGITYRISKL